MSNFKRFVIFADNHGDCVDVKVLKALLTFLDHWKPEIRIHAGDLWDFRPLRRGADEEEKRELMRNDFDAGMQFLELTKPTNFLRGNHDERLYMLRDQKKGIISEYAGSLVVEAETLMSKIGTKMLPYHKRNGVLEIGKLRAAHGYAHGVTAARRMAQVYGSVFFGHVHGIQSYSIEGIDNRVGRAIGCLCVLDMDYNRAHLASLVHRHGWAYGVIHVKSGLYNSFQAEDIAGNWIIPTDVVAL